MTVDWGRARYVLILWNHGDGVFGANIDNNDGHLGDTLRIAELAGALDHLKQGGVTLDRISFDSCWMVFIGMKGVA